MITRKIRTQKLYFFLGVGVLLGFFFIFPTNALAQIWYGEDVTNLVYEIYDDPELEVWWINFYSPYCPDLNGEQGYSIIRIWKYLGSDWFSIKGTASMCIYNEFHTTSLNLSYSELNYIPVSCYIAVFFSQVSQIEDITQVLYHFKLFWDKDTSTLSLLAEDICNFGEYCRFCLTQEECESKIGCSWVNDYCWWGEETPVLDWDNYYSQHSDFTTSTAFITHLTGFVTPIFKTISAWVNSFTDIFDIDKAGDRGTEFGEAIPKARGYLDIIDDFFGGFPISEIFLFFLMITIVIIVLKIILVILNIVIP